MYDWRQMTAEDRAHVLDVRRARQLPWHSPPHLDLEGTHQYLISAACYEHAQIIGKSPERMTEGEEALLKVVMSFPSPRISGVFCRIITTLLWIMERSGILTSLQIKRIGSRFKRRQSKN